MTISYTPEEITEILNDYFSGITHKQYIGARYVPIFGRKNEDSILWDNTGTYEPLTIVLYQGNSYTSRQYVPIGVDIANEAYWALTGNYNAQVEAYRREVYNLSEDVEDLTDIMQHKALFVFDTVADMQASEDLFDGAICHTNGFHESGDGGAAFYKITTTGTANGMDVIACGDMFANLVVTESYVTPEQFGAYGDGVHDDSNMFAGAFNFIYSVSVVSDVTKNAPKLSMTKKYNIGNFTVPTNEYRNIEIEGGTLIGSMVFGAVFQYLSFDGVSFAPSNGYAVTLSPNSSLEYKTVKFNRCNFRLGNGVNLNTRSINIHFSACTFQQCEIAFNCGDCDMALFESCWFDTKETKNVAYTIKQNATNESNITFNSCIIVNATTTLPTDTDYMYFVETNGILNFNNCRASNEGLTSFCVVAYSANTIAAIGGHRTGVSFISCDISVSTEYGIVSLFGIPSKIVMYGCGGQPSGGKLISLDSSISNAYNIRPQMLIDVSNNDFECLSIIKGYGNSNNASGVNLNASYIPSIPYELYFAISHGHRGQTDPLIVPLTNGFSYSIAKDTVVNLFKLPIKGTAYNSLRANGKSFWVRYTTQVPSANTWNTVMDVVTITENAGTRAVTKTNLFGEETSVTYNLVPNNESNPTEYTLTMQSSAKLLNSIDYGIFDNGFASI